MSENNLQILDICVLPFLVLLTSTILSTCCGPFLVLRTGTILSTCCGLVVPDESLRHVLHLSRELYVSHVCCADIIRYFTSKIFMYLTVYVFGANTLRLGSFLHLLKHWLSIIPYTVSLVIPTGSQGSTIDIRKFVLTRMKWNVVGNGNEMGWWLSLKFNCETSSDAIFYFDKFTCMRFFWDFES